MNCKSSIMVLLIGFLLLGGPLYSSANTNSLPEGCEGTSPVSHCYKDSGEEVPKEKETTVSPSQPEPGPSTFVTMIKVLLALAFVVGLMVLVLKLLHKRTQVVQQGKGIQTLGGAMLGNQRSLQLVKVGDRVLVVGVGDNVELIKEIEDEHEIKALVSHNGTQTYGSDKMDGLSKWVSSLWGNNNHSNGTSFKNILKQQLDETKQSRNAFMESLKKGHDND
ncbi:flagellar biosynthetic protein FliO [Pseudalkalibacillus salsuginis]|uniref:flagellar biosynthetic protein FliO n=1 Tax=Pseudalkalibacillus salsuginis TaxID=2910972 RepID=UPI001F30E6CC|nr:flagellar biosynthetic protein FliO [Pseudalkalibacillus salsuginis]MCF6410579.1 flagellar biosynthetic protein FliO [Pseudalkalibacillus salsuginis]